MYRPKPLVTRCNKKGPIRYLWGNPTNLICMLPAYHKGPHNDPSLSGYSQFWYSQDKKPASKD